MNNPMATLDRKRSNLLRHAEQRLVQYLCARLPLWVNSDMMTAFGFYGSLWLGEHNRFFLLNDHRCTKQKKALPRSLTY